MKVLITFALETEFAAWRRNRRFSLSSAAAYPAFDSNQQPAQLRAVITGVGPAQAQRVAQQALQWQPDLLIAAGFCGALNPQIRSGEVLAAASVRDFETHRSLSASARILAEAAAAGARRISVLSTCAYAISSVADKQRMAPTADAVDMESFLILNAAHDQGIPGIALRAVSDAADENLPFDFTQALDSRGRIRAARLASKIALAPQRIPALIRLGLASRRAANRLAAVLEQTIQALAATPESITNAVAEALTA